MPKSEKKVLLITDSFPPRSGGASVRMRGLAKYLPLYGWEPTVLTVDLPNEPDKMYRVIQVAYPGDVTEHIKRKLRLNPKEGLQDQLGIPDQISMAKDPITGKIIKRVLGWITYPDQKKLWKPVAEAAIRDLLAWESYQAILSSSPPEVTHMIAHEINQEFEIPWVADFRDLWTENHYYPYDSIRKYFDKRLERVIISQAQALVTVSEPLCATLQSLHKNKKVESIPNGFDPDEMISGDLHDKFSITYTGQLYQGKRDPEMLFKVIRDLLQEGKIKDDLLINFYGNKVFWVDALIKEYGLEKIAFQKGKVERKIAVNEQRSSQILLSLNWDNPKEKGVFTGKIFEYLAAKRPILALGGPRGVVTKLLNETRTGFHIQNEQDLREVILEWYGEFQLSGAVSYQGNDKIHDYSHDQMAQKYSEVLNDICESQ